MDSVTDKTELIEIQTHIKPIYYKNGFFNYKNYTINYNTDLENLLTKLDPSVLESENRYTFSNVTITTTGYEYGLNNWNYKVIAEYADNRKYDLFLAGFNETKVYHYAGSNYITFIGYVNDIIEYVYFFNILKNEFLELSLADIYR